MVIELVPRVYYNMQYTYVRDTYALYDRHELNTFDGYYSAHSRNLISNCYIIVVIKTVEK